MDMKLLIRPESSCHTPTNAQDLSNDQFIIQFPAYRRLCNIVKEHELTNCKSIFRNNLIKQLYFLLKLTPIIQSALTQNFLGQVEQWYNLNDHKKIKLASKNLESMMKTISAPKDRYKDDSSINNQFYKSENYIRPNTAKYSSFKTNIRPISSYKGQISTNVCTNQQYRQEQPSFTVNIEQELQRSQDFINRHRTVHPQQQPYHEQLFKLVNHKTQTKKQQYKRNFSANVLTRKSNNFKPAPQLLLKQQNKENQDENQDIPDIGQIYDEEVSQNDSASDIQTHISKTKKVYQNDQKKIKRPLTALATSNTLTTKQKEFLARVEKISTLQQSKQLRRAKQDNLFISQKRQYIRRKVKLNQDINRKIQARRMKSQSKILYKKVIKQQPFPTQKNQQKVQIIDLTEGIPNKNNKELPKYNEYAFFKTKRQNSLKQWKRPLRYSQPKDNFKLSTFINTCRINSALKFDLLSQENIEKHNQENLEEMIKIKEKLYGRVGVDSKALMKGLYIDAYDNLNQQSSTQCLWKNKDPKYLMVSNGTKKKKKSKRKLLKKKQK